MGRKGFTAKGYNKIFKRVEKKYILTSEQHDELLKRWEEYIEPDEYPHSQISNIYYDTEDDNLIRKSIEKPVYKEKLRLRTYGKASLEGNSFLELKKKYKGVVYKRRLMMPLEKAKRFLDEGILPEEDNQIVKEIDYCLKWYHLVPRMFVYYDRDSFRGKEDPDIRITFDTNIQGRREDLQLEKNLPGELLSEEPFWVMEIKVPMAYPQWLIQTLMELKIYPTSFSKYGHLYKKEKRGWIPKIPSYNHIGDKEEDEA